MNTSSSVGLTRAVTIPMTRPSRSSSGPPELPGLTAASIWMSPVQDLVAARRLERAVQPGDDAGADRAAEPERAAHGERLAALLDAPLAEHRRDEAGWRFDGADDRDVVLRLGADDLARRLGPVGEGQPDAGRVADDVEAGQDVAVEIDDDAAAEAAILAVGASSSALVVSISTSDGRTAW